MRHLQRQGIFLAAEMLAEWAEESPEIWLSWCHDTGLGRPLGAIIRRRIHAIANDGGPLEAEDLTAISIAASYAVETPELWGAFIQARYGVCVHRSADLLLTALVAGAQVADMQDDEGCLDAA